MEGAAEGGAREEDGEGSTSGGVEEKARARARGGGGACRGRELSHGPTNQHVTFFVLRKGIESRAIELAHNFFCEGKERRMHLSPPLESFM